MRHSTYSLVLNLSVLLCLTILAAIFHEPLMVLGIILGIVLQTHALSGEQDDKNDDQDEEPESCIGFTANLKEKD